MSLGDASTATQPQVDRPERGCRLLHIGGVLLIAAVSAVILVVAISPAWIISAAFGHPVGHGGGPDVQGLVTILGTLSSDALDVMAPVASLGGIVGGIMWALGSQRGQGIVIGSVVGGLMAVTITTILQ